MESNLFLIFQTLAGIGMNKLMTVHTSKSGRGGTFSSNLKLCFCVSTSSDGKKDISICLLKHILNVCVPTYSINECKNITLCSSC